MKRSSLLLAGGLGTRLNGKEKALLPLGDITFIENSLQVLDEVSDEVIVSLRDVFQVRSFSSYTVGRKIVTDSIMNRGPLAGMLEGFRASTGDYVFVVACDMPFLNPDVIDVLFEMAEGHDALIPVGGDGKKEPLHAVYRRDTMLHMLENSIRGGDRHVMAPVLRLNDVIYMDKSKVKGIDGQISTFSNINSPEDMEILSAENKI